VKPRARTARLDRRGLRPYPWGMGDAPDNHELDRRIAVLEERMKTMNAKYESALDRNNAAYERLRVDMANQKVWLFALVFGAVVTGITLGLAFSG